MEDLDVQGRETEVDEFCAPACGVLGDGFSKHSQNVDGKPLNFLSARRIAPPSSPFS